MANSTIMFTIENTISCFKSYAVMHDELEFEDDGIDCRSANGVISIIFKLDNVYKLGGVKKIKYLLMWHPCGLWVPTWMLCQQIKMDRI